MKLTDPQRRLLECIPDDWSSVPIFGDSRPRGPLIRAGLVEVREIDETPSEMEPSPVRFVDQQWRRTDLGRSALTQEGEVMKLTKAQQSARIAILAEIDRLGGSAMWSQLHSKGHHYGQVKATVTRGDTIEVGAYCFSLTPAGRAVLEPHHAE